MFLSKSLEKVFKFSELGCELFIYTPGCNEVSRKINPHLYSISSEIKNILNHSSPIKNQKVVLLIRTTKNKCPSISKITNENIIGVSIYSLVPSHNNDKNEWESENEISIEYINSENSLEIIKYILENEKSTKCRVYTPSQSLSELLMNSLNFHSPRLTQTSSRGYKYKVPLITLSRSISNPKDNLKGNLKDNLKGNLKETFETLSKYKSISQYKFQIEFEKDSIKKLYDSVYDVLYVNKKEAGGRIEVERKKENVEHREDREDREDCELVARLPVFNEYSGDGNNVTTKIYGIGYHTHLLKNTKGPNESLYLVGWPSGDDYLTDFMSRFIYPKCGRYLSLVASDHGIYSVRMTQLAYYAIRYILMENFKEDYTSYLPILYIIGVGIKYYFKEVEDLRNLSDTIENKMIRVYLSNMRNCTRDTYTDLVSRMNIEKLIQIIKDESLTSTLLRGINKYLKGGELSENEYFQLCNKIDDTLSPIFNFTFFETFFVNWKDLIKDERKLFLELIINQDELEECQKVIDGNDPYERNFLPLPLESSDKEFSSHTIHY